MKQDLPQQVCFRVTRHCNARCRFCLAPPDNVHPDAEVMQQRLDWLLSHGVRIIHFSGGEPTTHPGLPDLVAHVHAHGGKTKLTTNAIAISDALVETLRAAETEVKVSLHGDREHHNAMVGVRSFDHTTGNLKRLLESGIRTSVQATVLAEETDIVDWLIDYCLETGVRRLSILPFIPRGSGNHCPDTYQFSTRQRSALREEVKKRRRTLTGKLDLRWLDFNAHPIHVVEPDGRVVLEAETEMMDKVLCRISTEKQVAGS
jgi:MoaA/NifB/PqqE/SkfB family radical SAM enzyme